MVQLESAWVPRGFPSLAGSALHPVRELWHWFVLGETHDVLVVLPSPLAVSARGGWMETWPELVNLQAVLQDCNTHSAPSVHP